MLARRGIAARDETFHHAIARFAPHTGLILSRATSTIRRHNRVRLTMKRALQLAEIFHQGMAVDSIRSRLLQNRKTSPLFDVARTCRDIEAAYVAMWETYRRGESPRSFRVQPN